MIQLATESVAWQTLSDEQIMHLVSRDSDDAFAELHRRYRNRIAGLLRRNIPNESLIEDLVQDVFLRIFNARRRYVASGEFKCWILTIANNVSLNARRSLARRGQHFCEGTENRECEKAESTNEGPLQQAVRKETCERVRSAIGKLQERQAYALQLNRLHGLDYASVADRLEIGTNAVKSLLARARTNLAQYLDSEL